MSCARNIYFCVVVLFITSLESTAVAKPPEHSRHLLCASNGWFQNTFFCTRIITRLKTALCSVIAICGNPSAADSQLTPAIDESLVGPPYWIIDDAINITTFLNLTGDNRHLKTLCSEDGWLQHYFICTKIMARVKAVFCSVMSIKACANENSALQDSLGSGYVGPPYWIIDDAGMNITVFLNMTGYSAPNQSASVPSTGRFTTERHQNFAATQQMEILTTELSPDIPTTEVPNLTGDFQKPTHSNPVVPTTASSTVTPTIHTATSDMTPLVSTRVQIIETSSPAADSTIYTSIPRLDHSTSQRIAEVVSKAVAEEVAKKLKIKLTEKLALPFQ